MVENYSGAVGLGESEGRDSRLSLELLQSSHTSGYLSINLLVFCLFLKDKIVQEYYLYKGGLLRMDNSAASVSCED